MKRFWLVFAAALVCIWACEKEPADSSAGNDPEHALTPEQIFWGVVGQLIDVNDITPDYQGKTFQPAIGTEVEPGVRVVGVNSLEAAVRKFNNLTGSNIDTLKTTYTYSSKEVGSLVWNKSTDNKSWATVDVNVPAVPSLQKIVYRSAAQGDVNGSVGDGGSAYYRFGDVVKHFRKEDGQLEYWVCVRPAFDYEGKGESHWISVSPLPQSNIWPYYETKKPFKASNDMEYGLPYNIREDTEWYQDLAEMLFAICYPEQWSSNIISYSSENMFGSPKGLPIFNDFHSSNLKYHNDYFWRNVQNQWRGRDIVKMLFGISYEEMEAAVKQPIAGDPAGRGLHFLYKGHSWWTKTSNKPQLWEAHYTNDGTKDTQRNMHKMTPNKPCSQVVTPNNKTEGDKNYPMNVYNLTLQKPYLKEPRFFGDDAPRWIIRYATGEELAENGKWNPQLAMMGFDGENEVYRYYRDVVEKNLTEAPEETTTVDVVINDKAKQNRTNFNGHGHYRVGDVLRDQDGKRWIVVKPAGTDPQDVVPDYSPFAELISFEGIQYGNEKKIATNIVNRQQAMRFMNMIWLYSQEANKHILQDPLPAGIEEEDTPRFWHIYSTVKEKAEVDLHHLSTELVMPKYSITAGGAAESWSIAYYEPGSERQHLLRCVVQMGPVGGTFLNMMYDKYPKKNTTTSDSYWDLTPDSFSQDYIYLDDIADQQKVNKYADDYVARTPTSLNQSVQRSIRTQAEERAKDASKYAYLMSAWSTNSQPTGMWNEPVLLFRATALYDRGTEFATTSDDGLTFAVIGHGGFIDELSLATNGGYDYGWISQAISYQGADNRHVNGTYDAIPTWQSLWNK